MASSNSYRIGIVQMDSGGDVEVNLSQVFTLVEQASQQGASLLALPEMFLYMGSHSGRLEAAVNLYDENDPTMVRLKEVTVKHNIWLMLGSIPEYSNDDSKKVYNTAILLGPDGRIHAHYRKVNLFQAKLPNVSMRESDFFLAGDEAPPVVKTPLGSLGFSICFDLRFCEHYRSLRKKGAELVFVPANFTIPTGEAHWEVLLRSRAIENQFFIVAPAQVGLHNGKGYSSYGHSMLVDPWGKVLCCQPKGIGLLVAEVDLEKVRTVRNRVIMNHG